MAGEKINLVQGDTRPQLVFSVTDDKSGQPFDLSASGTTAQLKFRAAGEDTIKATMACGKLPGIVTQDGSIDYNAPYNTLGAGGRLYMNWSADALDEAGEFEGELEITFSDGTVQTAYDLIRFKVREKF